MDDFELAKRAVKRGVLSEEHLREAMGYAEGGRSLLSVLLDMGYLRAADLSVLMDPPAPTPPVRRSTFGRTLAWITVILIVAGVARATKSKQKVIYVPKTVVAPAPPAPRLSGDSLARLGYAHLRKAEELRGRSTPETDDQLRRAIVLLEEAHAQGFQPSHLSCTLGRAHEQLKEWREAKEAYQASLEEDPDHLDSLVGAARIAVLDGDHRAAMLYAQKACIRGATGEAFFLRARAELGLGDTENARRDLLEARKRDSSLAPAANALLSKIGE